MSRRTMQNDAPSHPSATCTVAEAAAILGCSTWFVYELLKRNRLPALRIGKRRVHVLRAPLAELLESGGTLTLDDGDGRG